MASPEYNNNLGIAYKLNYNLGADLFFTSSEIGGNSLYYYIYVNILPSVCDSVCTISYNKLVVLRFCVAIKGNILIVANTKRSLCIY